MKQHKLFDCETLDGKYLVDHTQIRRSVSNSYKLSKLSKNQWFYIREKDRT